MSVLDTLIIDRTNSDVKRAKYLLSLWDQETCEWAGTDEELEELESGPPGLYLAKDLNRVESASEYIAGLLSEIGSPITLQTKTDWESIDVPNKTQTARILQNIQALRSVLPLFAFTPKTPADMDSLTFWEANNIEKILMDVNRAIQNKKNAFVYSGQMHSGMLASIPQAV